MTQQVTRTTDGLIELKRSNFPSEQALKDYLIRVYGHQCWLEHFQGRLPDDDYLKQF